MDTLAAAALTGLWAHFDDGPPPSLHDPHRRRPTPPDHYGLTALALASRTRNPESPSWEKPVSAYLAIPSRQLGHHPFNRLLLLLLRNELAYTDPLVEAALCRCPLSSRYPSNNWSLLAQLSRILESSRNLPETTEAIRDYQSMLGGWMTDAGGFIDYPSKPERGNGATPIAYHHKALLLTAIAVCYAGATSLADKLRLLLDWGLQWSDSTGLCGGFGRSNHAIFGDTCLLGSLILLRRAGISDNGEYEAIVDRMTTRLKDQRRNDGLLWLTPAGAGGWDDYMHLTVYNAWFAAILSWAAKAQLSPLGESLQWPASHPALFLDEAAGLGSWRVKRGPHQLEAMFATSGQPPQSFSSRQIEFRYAGGTVFGLALDGKSLIPPPIRVGIEALRKQPCLAGSVPVFEQEGELFGLVELEVNCVDERNNLLTVELRGTPSSLTPDARRRGIISTLIHALDWRFLDSRLARRRALRRQALGGVTCSMKLTISAPDMTLNYSLRVIVRGPTPILYMNPNGWAFIAYSSSGPGNHVYPSSVANSICGADESRTLVAGTYDFEHTLRLSPEVAARIPSPKTSSRVPAGPS